MTHFERMMRKNYPWIHSKESDWPWKIPGRCSILYLHCILSEIAPFLVPLHDPWCLLTGSYRAKDTFESHRIGSKAFLVEFHPLFSWSCAYKTLHVFFRMYLPLALGIPFQLSDLCSCFSMVLQSTVLFVDFLRLLIRSVSFFQKPRVAGREICFSSFQRFLLCFQTIKSRLQRSLFLSKNCT